MKKILLLIAATSLLVVAAYLFIEKSSDDDELTFSNTQNWDPTLLETATNLSVFTQEKLSQIHITPPPSNESEETKQELESMHAMIALRTPEKIAQINNELSVQDTLFGSTTIAILASKETHPYTSALIDKTSELSSPFLFNMKKRFDRVRPSYLDPTLTTVLEVPHHPAYPSGHSLQSMLIALLLSELDPQREKEYMASALRVARNREIAGFHYQSDSAAGQELARQLFPILMEHPDYAELFKQAEKEWQP